MIDFEAVKSLGESQSNYIVQEEQLQRKKMSAAHGFF